MSSRYDGPDFMRPYFYSCLPELQSLLSQQNVHQGIQCSCGHTHLRIFLRVGLPVVFAHCELCQCKFKIYANEDYPAGYIPDDHTQPLDIYKCNCGGQVFQVAAGYEYPGDEMDSTDITWFTLVGKCLNCGKLQELFHDETG